MFSLSNLTMDGMKVLLMDILKNKLRKVSKNVLSEAIFQSMRRQEEGGIFPQHQGNAAPAGHPLLIPVAGFKKEGGEKGDG